MKIDNRLLDKVVCIKLKDHTLQSQVLTIHVVYGRIIQIDKEKVVLAFWECQSKECKDSSINNEYIAIIKSAIIDIKELR